MNQKGFVPILIVISVLITGLVVLGGYWYINQRQSASTPQPSTQTQDKYTSIKDQGIIPNNPAKTTIKQTKFSFLTEGDVWVSNDNNTKKITDYKHNYSIILSKDLSRIAYFSTPLDQVKFAESVVHIGGYGLTRNIWLINFDGTNPKKLTSTPGYLSELKFSPSGKYLAYINLPSNELSVVDLDTSNTIIQQTMDGLWAKYRWNTDSSSLVIAAQTKTNSPSDLVGINIFKIDLNSKKLDKIESVAPFGNSYEGLDFSISPDLKHLSYFGEKQNVVSYGVSNYDWGYWMANLDGTVPKEILVKKASTKDHGPNINFSWSPDGNYLAFFDEDHNMVKTSLKVYEVNTGKLYTATESESSFMTWDQNNNLYLKQFVPNVGVNNYVSRVDFKTGQLEKFLDNTEELSFGD